MPGIHFVHSLVDDLRADIYDVALRRLLHDEAYEIENIACGQTTRLDLTRYQQYPIEVVDDDRYTIIVEGRLHNLRGQTLPDGLKELLTILQTNDSNRLERLRRWLLEQDGDFLLMIRDKASGRWFFLNDVLGRLPVYSYRDEHRCCLSREIRFIAHLLNLTAFDHQAVAEYLLFGYPLGERTLLDNIQRLPGGTLLQWSDNNADLTRLTVEPFDFSRKQAGAHDKTSVGELVELFVEACSRQSDAGGTNLLSLSGGLDSRAVAAGLVRAERSFRAMTFEDASGLFTSDSIRARELAEALGLDWDLSQLPPVTGRDLRRIIRMKGGMNYVASAFALPFMDEIERRFGRDLVYFSGDGGDKVLPDLRPSGRCQSVRSLTDYVIDRHQLLPIRFVAGLTGVPCDQIRRGVEERLHSYPEEAPDQKYVHFMIYERAMRWLFEGEDCNRCHFRTATPFYSLPFFTAAMSIPDERKANHALYREFLTTLSPEAAAIPDATRGLPITSPAYGRRMRTIGRLARYPRLLRSIKRTVAPGPSYSCESSAMKAIAVLSDLPAVDSVIDTGWLRWITRNSDEFGRDLYDNLLTLLMLLDDLSDDTDRARSTDSLTFS